MIYFYFKHSYQFGPNYYVIVSKKKYFMKGGAARPLKRFDMNLWFFSLPCLR